jgi:hypothetical protein
MIMESPGNKSLTDPLFAEFISRVRRPNDDVLLRDTDIVMALQLQVLSDLGL